MENSKWEYLFCFLRISCYRIMKKMKIPLYIDTEDIDVVTPVFMSTDSSHKDDDRNLLNVERRKLREEVIKY